MHYFLALRDLFIPKMGLVKTYQGRPVEGVMKNLTEFAYENCHFKANADENAAKNIENKALGRRVIACGSNLMERAAKPASSL